MPPLATMGSFHACPLSTGPVPHVGGPIIAATAVLVSTPLPPAVLGDMAVCVGPPDSVAMGSPLVIIGGAPAARVGDMTSHGGTIAVGVPTIESS